MGKKTSTSFTSQQNPGGQPGNRGNTNPEGNRFTKGNAGGVPGRVNRTTIGREFAVKEGITDKERPLAFFIAMMKGNPFKVRKINPADGKVIEVDYYPTIEDMRWGAAMAAPYMHPKLANIEHTGDVTVRHEDFIGRLMEEDDGDAVRH